MTTPAYPRCARLDCGWTRAHWSHAVENGDSHAFVAPSSEPAKLSPGVAEMVDFLNTAADVFNRKPRADATYRGPDLHVGAAPPPESAAPPACDSGTFAELPAAIRNLFQPMATGELHSGHLWDNMTRDEQRAWLIERLAALTEENARLRSALAEFSEPDVEALNDWAWEAEEHGKGARTAILRRIAAKIHAARRAARPSSGDSNG